MLPVHMEILNKSWVLPMLFAKTVFLGGVKLRAEDAAGEYSAGFFCALCRGLDRDAKSL